jgi:hypothetical protein
MQQGQQHKVIVVDYLTVEPLVRESNDNTTTATATITAAAATTTTIATTT